MALEFQDIKLVDNSKCLYHHMDTVQLGFRIMTHSNILSSSVTDPICVSGNRDEKDPERLQLQENPCTTHNWHWSIFKLWKFKHNYSQLIWCKILVLPVFQSMSTEKLHCASFPEGQ